MTRGVLAAVVVSVLGGCSDGDCVHGVCPDLGETRAFPGPCVVEVGGDYFDTSCDFTYDDGGHLASATCRDHTHDTGNDDGDRMRSSTWTWTGDDLTGLEETAADHRTTRWTFGPDQITNDDGQVFDRATFAFRPMIGDAYAAPSGELGLVSQSGVVFTWVPTSGGVTRQGGGDEVHYALDDAGRILGIDAGPSHARESWRYDGDRIVSRGSDNGVDQTDWSYRYDAGGNVASAEARSTFDNGVVSREAYGYGCWH